jgi:hypothetical protein
MFTIFVDPINHKLGKTSPYSESSGGRPLFRTPLETTGPSISCEGNTPPVLGVLPRAETRAGQAVLPPKDYSHALVAMLDSRSITDRLQRLPSVQGGTRQ